MQLWLARRSYRNARRYRDGYVFYDLINARPSFDKQAPCQNAAKIFKIHYGPTQGVAALTSAQGREAANVCSSNVLLAGL